MSQTLERAELTALRDRIIEKHPYLLTIEDKIDPMYLFCTACEESESSSTNEIFYCDLCDTPVHRRCYGEPLVSLTDKSKNWFCQRCEALIEDPNQPQIECALCPEINMAMKSVSLSRQGRVTQEWVHLSCLRRLPKIDKKGVFETEYHSHQCFRCNDSRGYTVQCAFIACQKYYHIGCAKTSGMILQEIGMQYLRMLFHTRSKSHSELNVYCSEHVDSNIARLEEENPQHAEEVCERTTVVRTYRLDTWYRYNSRNAERFVGVPRPVFVKQEAPEPPPPEKSASEPKRNTDLIASHLERLHRRGLQQCIMAIFQPLQRSNPSLYGQMQRLVASVPIEEFFAQPNVYATLSSVLGGKDASPQPEREEEEIQPARPAKPKKYVNKAKLIRSYANNLTDADILDNIQNLKLKEYELDLVIPKRYRALRGEYEKTIKENLHQKLMELRREFIDRNKDEAMEQADLYIQVHIDLCKFLFEEHLDVYNLGELQLYIWGYFCLNGLMDSRCERMNLQVKKENPVTTFWFKKARTMGLAHDAYVLDFIKQLQVRFMKVLNRTNEMQQIQKKIQELAGEQVIIIEEEL